MTDLDTTTFNTPNGYVTNGFNFIPPNQSYSRAIALQTDGKIVMVGNTLEYPTITSVNSYVAVCRYNTNGTLDTSFGTSGLAIFLIQTTTPPVGPSITTNSLAIQPNGSIVVCGYILDNTGAFFQAFVVRFTSSGILDTTNFASPNGYIFITPTMFNLAYPSNGFTECYAESVQIDTNKIVIGGYARGVGPAFFTLARLDLNGGLDSTFGINGLVANNFTGSEEFGFATAPLVVSGCVRMRVCHLDTCPVVVATQNPELRKRFTGKPEFFETFFEYIAQEVREILASLGFRSLSEAVGAVESLETSAAVEHWKASGLDLSPILAAPESASGSARRNTTTQDHGLEAALDNELIKLSQSALESKSPIKLQMKIRNGNRTVGTMLGSEITRKYGGQGLADDTIDITFHGSAGQSLGAFIPRGLTLRLYGDTNDYLGKGLSGGRVILRPDEKAKFASHENVNAGNVIGYGATQGEIFVRGIVGERFCVRNSGALAVVEGVGDHGCEYMTGGTVVILGKTGRNFAAGMSGGRAFVLDLIPSLVNTEMVDVLSIPKDQEEKLKSILSRFYAETGSLIAHELLGDWQAALKRFSLVMPRDYAKVLAVIDRAEREGKSSDDAIMEALNG